MRRIMILALMLSTALPALAAQRVEVVVPDAWLLNDPNTNVVSLELRFEGGLALDPAALAGRSDVMAGMMTRGAGSRDASTLTQVFKDNAISLGVRAGRDETVVGLTAPVQSWDVAQGLLRDVLFAPRFDSGELARVRAQALAGINSNLSDPDWRAQRLVNGLVFANSPYATPGAGNPSSIARLAPADLKAAHQSVFAHKPVGAVFVGAVTPDMVRETLSLFDDKAASPAETVQGDARTLTPRQIYHPFDVAQTSLSLVYPALSPLDPDFAALAVLDALLADGFGSRLMKALREESGLSYGISSMIVHTERGDLWQFSLATRPDKAAEAAAIIRKTLRDADERDFTGVEIREARESLAAGLPLGWTSSPAIVGQLSSAQRNGFGPDYLTEWQARLRAVTAADIRRVAQRLTRDTTGLAIAVGPRSPGKDWETLAELPGMK